MLVITVEFLHGTYRADPDGTAHTGFLDRGEWPPAPSRLFAALVAADGTGGRCRVTDGSELSFLESLPPPTIRADDSSTVMHNVLEPRFIVEGDATFNVNKERRISSTQEYVGRKASEVRPGVRVCPRHPVVSFAWDIDEIPDAVRRGLELRAARVGYLGCADSPVQVTVAGVAAPDETPAYTPDPTGDLALGVPQPGLLDALDRHYAQWLQLGPSLRRGQSPGLRRLVTYRRPAVARTASREPASELLWFALGSSVSGRRVLSVTETFRRTVLDRYDRICGDVPAVLHGHDLGEPGYDSARFLALADVGHRHATGQIHGVAIWLPAGTSTDIVDNCRSAMASATGFVGPGFASTISPWAGAERPLAANPTRWSQSALRWATVFPALHERRVKRVDVAVVGDWCKHAGLPRPVAVREGRSPFVAGAVDLAPSEVNRVDRPHRRYSHIEMIFERPVNGPVVIGAGRQFGFGLCVPVTDV